MVMAAPPMPDDLQMVQPDPSLPKELSAFFGKWEGSDVNMQFFLIIEKIDKEKASVLWWQSGYPSAGVMQGWFRREANVSKERGKYKLWFASRAGGINELTLKGENLEAVWPSLVDRLNMIRFRRVP
jgi:hypothetical protein